MAKKKKGEGIPSWGDGREVPQKGENISSTLSSATEENCFSSKYGMVGDRGGRV